MNFLSPLMLIGLAAMLIPPLLHLLMRRKPKRIRFPALEFISSSHKKTSRRFRIHQFALMLVRSLFLGMLAMAIARPILNSSQESTEDFGDDGATMVIVLDNSYSMGYLLEDESLLDAAKIMAGNALDRPGVQAALVIAGPQAKAPFEQVSGDVDAVIDAIGDIEVGTHARNLSGAVTMAYSILSQHTEIENGKVIVLSTPIGLKDLPQPPEDVSIDLVPVDVARGQKLPNRALQGIQMKPAPRMGAGYWELSIEVANYSADAIQNVPIQVELNRKILVNGFVNVDAGEVGTKTFYFSLSRDQNGPAKIVMKADALSVDDELHFWLSPSPPVRVLAVNGDPNATPYRDELFYLKKIAEPALTAGARMDIKSITSDRLTHSALRNVDVVVLANVGDLTNENARSIRAFVEGGGGLFVTMGSRINPKKFNQTLGPILPRTLRSTRVAGDASASVQSRDRGVSLIKTFDSNHPILEKISRPEISSLALVQTKKYMLLDPAPTAGGSVVMSLDDGAPLLLTSEHGAGRVALFASSLDRDWTDLAIRPHFLPLMVDTFRYLTRVRSVDPHPILAGQPAEIQIGGDDMKDVKVRGPKGDLYSSARPESADEAWQFSQTNDIGHYRIEQSQGRVELGGFAVRVDPIDGRLNATVKVDGDDKAVQTSTLVQERRELWHWALILLFILLASEAALLFRRRQTSKQGNRQAIAETP